MSKETYLPKLINKLNLEQAFEKKQKRRARQILMSCDDLPALAALANALNYTRDTGWEWLCAIAKEVKAIRVTNKPRKPNPNWKNEIPTLKQNAYLKRNNIPYNADTLTRGEATSLIFQHRQQQRSLNEEDSPIRDFLIEHPDQI